MIRAHNTRRNIFHFVTNERGSPKHLVISFWSHKFNEKRFIRVCLGFTGIFCIKKHASSLFSSCYF